VPYDSVIHPDSSLGLGPSSSNYIRQCNYYSSGRSSASLKLAPNRLSNLSNFSILKLSVQLILLLICCFFSVIPQIWSDAIVFARIYQGLLQNLGSKLKLLLLIPSNSSNHFIYLLITYLFITVLSYYITIFIHYHEFIVLVFSAIYSIIIIVSCYLRVNMVLTMSFSSVAIMTPPVSA